MDEVSAIGIDLARRSFQVNDALADGLVGFRTQLSREKVLDVLASQSLCMVVNEAARAPTSGLGRSRSSVTRPVDPTDGRQGVYEAEEGQLGGRGGDLRGSAGPAMSFVEVRKE